MQPTRRPILASLLAVTALAVSLAACSGSGGDARDLGGEAGSGGEGGTAGGAGAGGGAGSGGDAGTGGGAGSGGDAGSGGADGGSDAEGGDAPDARPPCAGPADCQGDPSKAFCDAITGQCRGCASNDECGASAGGEICDGASGKCRPCATDDDCDGAAGGPVCEPTRGACVACTEAHDVCPTGQYCEPSLLDCTFGCAKNAGCAGDPGGAFCDTAAHACVECLVDDDCAAGFVCAGHACAPGCTPAHGCPTGLACCDSACVDTESDVDHCGACSSGCAPIPNATIACESATCTAVCDGTWADCDGVAANGCEWDTALGGPCVCAPGSVESCYDGPPDTAGVGTCTAGTHTCDATGTTWGPCEGQVVPVFELCANGLDDDCSGAVDDPADRDGDGWTICDGDCCDTPDCAPEPGLVNPGAFEVSGDGLDNDCDGLADNPAATSCGSGTKLTGVTGMDVALAMDLCQTTTANPPRAQKRWGLIAATQLHADGSAVSTAEAQNQQTAVKAIFGNTIVPRKNGTLAVLSTGMARAANDVGWVSPINGTELTSSITFPGGPPLSTYLAAHGGGLLPGACGGTTCPVGSGANDSIDVRLQLRVPTNAKGFSYDFRFFSAEYQTFQCTKFNDYFLALLASGSAQIPADRNVSFDPLGRPVSVNNGFFEDCGGNSTGCGTCPYGTAALAGTGFDQVNGGATEWLTSDVPVVPGETITLDLTIFDVGDHIYDSLVLLDNFRWHLDAVTLGTHH